MLELIESAVYLYQATKDPFLLEIGIDMLEAIEHSTKTKCGYATVSKDFYFCIFRLLEFQIKISLTKFHNNLFACLPPSSLPECLIHNHSISSFRLCITAI